ncbi:MAG: hypothetical protein WD825_17190 [Gemmatimonadaceae bacterium]
MKQNRGGPIALAQLARRIVAQPITDATWADRSSLIVRESLAAQILSARLRGHERRARRLERRIAIGEGGRAIERRILDATRRSTLAKYGVTG